MRVLVVGGSGHVGKLVIPKLAQQHELRLFDLSAPAADFGEFVRGSVTDPVAVRAAAEGHNALVYLAMGQRSGWGTSPEWVASQFEVNVTGLYLTLQAVAQAGVRQVVHTSTASVFANYADRDHALDPEPDADDVYGLSKRFGENVCAAAARRYQLSVVALRLVGPLADDAWLSYDGPHRDVVTAGSDVAEAYLAALNNPLEGFSAFLVTGDREQRILNWERTYTALGWRPTAHRPT